MIMDNMFGIRKSALDGRFAVAGVRF